MDLSQARAEAAGGDGTWVGFRGAAPGAGFLCNERALSGEPVRGAGEGQGAW